jgi:hypothetical protein
VRNQSADLKVAPLPGYVSNHVPRAGTGISADFRGCPGVALRRVGNTLVWGGRGQPQCEDWYKTIETVLDEGAKVVQEIENWLLSKRAKLFGRKSVPICKTISKRV